MTRTLSPWPTQRDGGLRGERNPRAKLTAAEVLAIRNRYETRGETIRALSAAYGVAVDTVRDIVRRETWGWLS